MQLLSVQLVVYTCVYTNKSHNVLVSFPVGRILHNTRYTFFLTAH